MFRIQTFVAVLLLPASVAAQQCTNAGIQCPNGRWVTIPCGATAADISAACGTELRIGGGGGTPSAPVMVQLFGGTVELFKDVNKAQTAAWSREASDRSAEVAAKYPPLECVMLLDELQASTEALAKEGEDFANGFAKDEIEGTIDALREQYKTKSKHEKAYEKYKALSDEIQAWSKDLREWETCLRTPGCKLVDLASKDKKKLQKWLQKMGWVDEAAADRVDRAADFLESYTTRIAEKNLAYAQKAAACSAR